MALTISKQINMQLDPVKHVVNHNGATSIFNAFVRSLLTREDEVILVQPCYLWYPALHNHGITFKLTKSMIDEENFKHAEIDFDNMRSLINERTKYIVIINPTNPDGRVWTRAELTKLAEIVRDNPHITVLSDEVYNRHIFDDIEFVPFATLDGMFERSITMYSFGKVFYCTGWRVGGASGPEHLIKPMKDFIRQNTDGVNVLSKMAIGYALKLAEEPYEGYNTYYEWNVKDFEYRRERVSTILRETKICDFDILDTMGTYCFIVNVEKVLKKVPMKYYYMMTGIPESEKRERITSFEEY